MLEISLQLPDPKKGGLYINDTAEHLGPFRGILCGEDSVVDVAGGTIGGTVTAVKIGKGQYLPVLAPRCKFASGSGVAYYP
jgi:hypothetical protein